MDLVETLKKCNAAGLTDRTAFLFMDEVRAFESAKTDLRDTVAFLQRSLDLVRERLVEGRLVNSLGEVQGQGLAVDRLCVQVEEKRRALEVLARSHCVTLKTLGLA